MQNKMFDELVRGLLSILPAQTVQIVLYGSAARGTATPESDIDIALFLRGKLSHAQQDQLSGLKSSLPTPQRGHSKSAGRSSHFAGSIP